jgi:hypothetical protein
MENFDAKKYRANLAKDLKDIHKEDPSLARDVLEQEKNTYRYRTAEIEKRGLPTRKDREKETWFIDEYRSEVLSDSQIEELEKNPDKFFLKRAISCLIDSDIQDLYKSEHFITGDTEVDQSNDSDRSYYGPLLKPVSGYYNHSAPVGKITDINCLRIGNNHFYETSLSVNFKETRVLPDKNKYKNQLAPGYYMPATTTFISLARKIFGIGYKENKNIFPVIHNQFVKLMLEKKLLTLHGGKDSVTFLDTPFGDKYALYFVLSPDDTFFESLRFEKIDDKNQKHIEDINNGGLEPDERGYTYFKDHHDEEINERYKQFKKDLKEIDSYLKERN